MQFKIQVADRETGEESEIRLDAPTVQQARAKANEAGYLVSAIEPHGSTAASKKVDASPPSKPPSRSRPHRKPGQPDAPMAVGSIFGLILGAIIGYNLGGPLGIIVGAICGALAGMGIGAALAPPSEGNKLGAGGRFALAGITSGIAVAIFFGFCIVPLNWWNGLWSSDSNETSGRSSPAYDVGTYSEADRALRAAGKNPNEVSSGDRAELQRSIQNLSDTLEGNKQYAPSSLDRARDYARSEYESNKKIMSESEARRQYDKDLANIAQEARDKGVGR